MHACSNRCRRRGLFITGVDRAEDAKSLGVELASLVHHLLDVCAKTASPFHLSMEMALSLRVAAFVAGIDHDDELLLVAARVSAAVVDAGLVL